MIYSVEYVCEHSLEDINEAGTTVGQISGYKQLADNTLAVAKKLIRQAKKEDNVNERYVEEKIASLDKVIKSIDEEIESAENNKGFKPTLKRFLKYVSAGLTIMIPVATIGAIVGVGLTPTYVKEELTKAEILAAAGISVGSASTVGSTAFASASIVNYVAGLKKWKVNLVAQRERLEKLLEKYKNENK